MEKTGRADSNRADQLVVIVLERVCSGRRSQVIMLRDRYDPRQNGVVAPAKKVHFLEGMRARQKFPQRRKRQLAAFRYGC